LIDQTTFKLSSLEHPLNFGCYCPDHGLRGWEEHCILISPMPPYMLLGVNTEGCIEKHN